jgi:hypothetical protein
MSVWSVIAETWRNTPSPIQTIVTAAFGTMVGAWLTSRAQAKRRVIDELKAVRAAYALCFTIANKALALKRQHIRRMKEHHGGAIKAHNNRQANPVGPFQLSLDLQTLNQVSFASGVLTRTIFEKTALGPKGLAAVVALSDATDDLKLSIDYRNSLIAEFQKNPPATDADKIAFYLGFRNSAGMIDERYKGNIAALAHQVDDCIFFGMLLADELLSYGNKIHRRNRWRYRLGMQKILPADWTLAKKARLIPHECEYADWTKGFKRTPTRWGRVRTWLNDAMRPWRSTRRDSKYLPK